MTGPSRREARTHHDEDPFAGFRGDPRPEAVVGLRSRQPFLRTDPPPQVDRGAAADSVRGDAGRRPDASADRRAADGSDPAWETRRARRARLAAQQEGYGTAAGPPGDTGEMPGSLVGAGWQPNPGTGTAAGTVAGTRRRLGGADIRHGTLDTDVEWGYADPIATRYDRPEDGYLEGGYDMEYDDPRASSHDSGGGRAARRLLILLAVLSVVGLGTYGAWLGLRPAIGEVSGIFAPPEDFPGPGSGSTTVVVQQGDTGRAIGETLTAAGVVATPEAFVAAAKAEPEFASVQAGTYTLPVGIPAAQAVQLLLDPASQVRDLLTIPEGLVVSEILAAVAEHRDVPVQEVQAALTQITLPASAQGDPEGYLHPDSYEFGPDAALVEILQEMVQAGVTTRAGLGVPTDPTLEREFVIKASIVQAEGREEDFPNVASVIENRLAGEIPDVNTLGMDSTCKYAYRDRAEPWTDCLDEPDEPYNTRINPGLPPGPINSPGRSALSAVLNPPDTDYGWFVTVDTFTGETVFTASKEEFFVLEQRFDEFCEANGNPEGC
jgi:UPF0755 protein